MINALWILMISQWVCIFIIAYKKQKILSEGNVRDMIFNALMLHKQDVRDLFRQSEKHFYDTAKQLEKKYPWLLMWHDIEGAPKDGSYIQALCVDGKTTEIFRWNRFSLNATMVFDTPPELQNGKWESQRGVKLSHEAFIKHFSKWAPALSPERVPEHLSNQLKEAEERMNIYKRLI